MKKTLIVPLLAVAAFVGQAYAECNVGTNGTTKCCWWSATSCWGIGGEHDDMKTDAQCTENSGFPQSNCNAPSIEYCDWGPPSEYGEGGCFPIKDATERTNCQQNGSIVTSCPGGGTSSPGGGTSSPGGGTSSPSSGGGEHCKKDGNKLYCGYEGADPGCYKVQNEYSDDGDACASSPNAKGCQPCDQKIAACEEDGALFTSVNETPLNAAPWGKGENCKSLGGNQIGGKEDCGNNYCKWDTGCEKVNADPTGKYGPATANCAQAIENCQNDGKLFTSMSACQNDQGSSIRKLSFAATNNTLKAIHNGINVQLTGNTKIQVFDLKGNMARSLELAQGSYNVELSALPRGTYIVRVIGNSWKQTITVPVK